MMIEIKTDVMRHPRQRYLEIAAEVLQRNLPSETISISGIDNNEKENLKAARLHDGVIDLREYIIHQIVDRERFGVKDSHKVSTVISDGACVVENGRRINNPYGYSISSSSEATISTRSVERMIPEQIHRFTDLIIAYTIVHETGHLFGLVSSESRRHRTGKHCGNICVMQSTATPEATLDLIAGGMGGDICFCSECVYDLNSRH